MRKTFTALLLLFAVAIAGCGAVDLGSLPRVITGDRTPAAVVADADIDAIKNVIESANEGQVKAFASGDDSALRSATTRSYYDEIAGINTELASMGVVGFTLVGIDWGDVSVDRDKATATAYETWRTTYSDGSRDQRTDQNDYTLVRESDGWKVAANVQPSARGIAPTQPDQTQPDTTTPARISDTSSNWSGYVANGGTYTSVAGTWIVPTVSATSSGADATWVGIGGVTGTDLIQAGTQATVTGSGAVTYSAWTEILPDYSRPAPLAVSPGDSVTVVITEQTRNTWLIVMRNNTTGDSFEKTLSYNSSRSSAEWIQEAPSTDRGIVPLSNFGTVRFLSGSAVRDGQSLGLSALGATPVAMVNRAGQALAIPSTLGSDGSSFAVTRTDAPGTVQGGGRFRRRG